MSSTRIFKNIAINGLKGCGSVVGTGATVGGGYGIWKISKTKHDDIDYLREKLTFTSRVECCTKAIGYSSAKGMMYAGLPVTYPLFKVLESKGIDNPFLENVDDYYRDLLKDGKRRNGK